LRDLLPDTSIPLRALTKEFFNATSAYLAEDEGFILFNLGNSPFFR